MKRRRAKTGREKLPVKLQMKADIAANSVTRLNKDRLRMGFGLIVVLFVLLIFRLAYWQVVRAEDLQEKAAMMQREDASLEPVRGTIYDSNMKPLAQTVTKYELYGYTQDLYKSTELTEAEKEATIANLAEITGKSKEDIKKLLSSEENLVSLANGLNQEQIKKAEDLFGQSITVQTKIDRSYPNGDFAAHVIGTVNEENSGRIGLELQYNAELAGVKGRVVRTTDSQGNTLSLGSSKTYKAKDGYSVVTTLDTVIQTYVEEEIREGMSKYGAESIACIVMETKTGNILAMAKTPSFDPANPYEPSDKSALKEFDELSGQEQSDYLSRMWTNTSVSSLYEPGSTFKLICAASGLDSGTAALDSTYSCSGHITIDGIDIHCADGHVHGTQNLTKAVGNSCNVAMATVAFDMGRANYYNYINLFGYTDYTNIDLPGEAYPLIKERDEMSNVDFGSIGFGQGIAISPIQMITAVNAISNDGALMQPKIVKKIVDNSGNTIKEFPDVKVRQVITKDTADKMKDIMLDSVNNGGGLNAYKAGFRIGGKTGTADIPDEEGGYDGGNISSFVASAPMDDPEVSIIVIVTRPTRGVSLHGAYNASPMAGNILEKILVYKGVPRKYNDEEEETVEAKMTTVPDVTGVDSKTAKQSIANAGLKCKVQPANTTGEFQVVDQYPKAGASVTSGSTIYIYSQ